MGVVRPIVMDPAAGFPDREVVASHEDGEALDAYSRVVTRVAERLRDADVHEFSLCDRAFVAPVLMFSDAIKFAFTGSGTAGGHVYCYAVLKPI